MAGVWYGDIAPHTVGGKIIAMIYAVVWLPLFLVASTFIVQLLTNSQPKRKKKVAEGEKKVEI
jgi:Ion channel